MGFPRVGSNPTGVAFFDATTHGSRERLGDADAAKNGNRLVRARFGAARGLLGEGNFTQKTS